MTTRLFHAGAAAALLLAGTARAADARQAPTPPASDDARAAMHEAMQHQMASPPVGGQMPAQMPVLPDRASPTATRALEHAEQQRTRAREHVAEVEQQHRQAARERAMRRGEQDAAMARAGAMHRGAATPPHAGNGMMGEPSGAGQQGAGMRRTGDMHGGSNGMMPDGGGMPRGGMGGASTSPTSPTAPTGGGMKGK